MRQVRINAAAVVLATAVPLLVAGQEITDFNAEYTDDPNTIGLWHFNGDSANSAALGPSVPLILQGPTMVGPAGKFGGGLQVGGNGGGAYIFDEDYPQFDASILNGSFTIEMWIRPTEDDVDEVLRPTTPFLAHYKSFDTPNIADSGRGLELRIQNVVANDATVPGLLYGRSGEAPAVGTAIGPRGLGMLDGWDMPTKGPEGVLIPDVWNHVAVTRQSNTWRLWVNGINTAEVESAFTPAASSQPLIVGAVESFIRPMYGMIDEVRLSKVARDPSAPGYLDAPFADDPNTVGLWHFDADGSNSAAAASPTAVMSFKPNSFIEAGGKFGGALRVGGGETGQGGAFIENANIPELNQMLVGTPVQVTVGASLFPASSTGATPMDFTLECWIKPAAVDLVGDQGHITTGILEHYDSDTNSNRGFDLRIDNLSAGTAGRPSGTPGLTFWRSGDYGAVNTGTSSAGMGLLNGHNGTEVPLTADAWHHVAITRENELWTMWVDGQVVTQVTSSWRIPDSTAPFIVGAVQNFIRPIAGMIDEVRLSKVARNPGAPGYLDAPFADDADTVGLWHFDGDGSNAAAAASVTAVMTLQGASTFEVAGGKFGGALNVGSVSGATNSGGAYINDADIPELDDTIAGGPRPGTETGVTLVPDTWTHIGITRQGTTWRMWVNGAVVAEQVCEVAVPNGTRPLFIGYGESGAGTGLAGLIDEVRVSNVARDLSSVPGGPYVPDANTVALWHFDGDGSNAAPGASPKAAVKLRAGASFDPSGGMFGGALNANGAGGYVLDTYIPELDAALTGGDFTVECFVKPLAADVAGPGSPGIINKYQTGASNEQFQLRIDNNAQGTAGRAVALKGVPYFRTGHGVNIATACGTATVGGADFTIECWVKPDPRDVDPAVRVTTGILEHYASDGLNVRSFDLRIDNLDAGVAGRTSNTKGLVHCRFGDVNVYTHAIANGVGLLSDGVARRTPRSAVLLEPGVWTHVAWTRQWVDPGDDIWRLWINDRLVSELVGDWAIPDSFEPLVIGAGEDATPVTEPPGTNWLRPLHGDIDEVRISTVARVFGRTTPCVPMDFDCDGDVDVNDFAVFQLCFNGSSRPPAGANCDGADSEPDGDVDVNDFAVFQLCFNGASRPPACP